MVMVEDGNWYLLLGNKAVKILKSYSKSAHNALYTQNFENVLDIFYRF